VKTVNLRAGKGLFRLSDLPKVLGADVRGEQSDDGYNDQQFQKSEAKFVPA
jgi:hypothetical protein